MRYLSRQWRSFQLFRLQFAGGKITVVGNDGNDVEPVEVDRLIIGVAETYDLVVTIPDNMCYEVQGYTWKIERSQLPDGSDRQLKRLHLFYPS